MSFFHLSSVCRQKNIHQVLHHLKLYQSDFTHLDFQLEAYRDKFYSSWRLLLRFLQMKRNAGDLSSNWWTGGTAASVLTVSTSLNVEMQVHKLTICHKYTLRRRLTKRQMLSSDFNLSNLPVLLTIAEF